MEVTKVDIADRTSQSLDKMQMSLTNQTTKLSESYDKVCADLKARADKMSADFKEKMTTIKASISTYFARNDKSMQETQNKVSKLQSTIDEFTL